MKKFLMFLCLFLVIGVTSMASAGNISVINGSFETGDLYGWSTSGSGLQSAVTSDAGFSATDGTYFANFYAPSTLSQSTSWNAGDTLSFDWNFNSNDYMPYNDYSIFRVTNSDNSVLFDVTLSNVQATGSYNATGWNQYTYTFASEGSGSIVFGVYNGVDNGLPSQLYIDNVGAPVPEPATLLLLGLGLVGLAGVSRKKMRA